MFGLCLIEAPGKHAGVAASRHTPDSLCSRGKKQAADYSIHYSLPPSLSIEII